jgi:hypothetical protein
MVFDAPEVAGGTVLYQVGNWIRGHVEAEGAAERLQPVLVIRHGAVAMVLNDDMWKRLDAGTMLKLKEGPDGAPVTRNPFINYEAGRQHSMIGPNDGLDRLISGGAIVLACNLALGGQAFRLREREGMPIEEARGLIRAHLIPGVTVMPNGIFAVGRAQEAGCHYIRAT